MSLTLILLGFKFVKIIFLLYTKMFVYFDLMIQFTISSFFMHYSLQN